MVAATLSRIHSPDYREWKRVLGSWRNSGLIWSSCKPLLQDSPWWHTPSRMLLGPWGLRGALEYIGLGRLLLPLIHPDSCKLPSAPTPVRSPNKLMLDLSIILTLICHFHVVCKDGCMALQQGNEQKGIHLVNCVYPRRSRWKISTWSFMRRGMSWPSDINSNPLSCNLSHSTWLRPEGTFHVIFLLKTHFINGLLLHFEVTPLTPHVYPLPTGQWVNQISIWHYAASDVCSWSVPYNIWGAHLEPSLKWHTLTEWIRKKNQYSAVCKKHITARQMSLQDERMETIISSTWDQTSPQDERVQCIISSTWDQTSPQNERMETIISSTWDQETTSRSHSNIWQNTFQIKSSQKHWRKDGHHDIFIKVIIHQ